MSEMQQPKRVSKVLLRNTILQTDAHNRVCSVSAHNVI